MIYVFVWKYQKNFYDTKLVRLAKHSILSQNIEILKNNFEKLSPRENYN